MTEHEARAELVRAARALDAAGMMPSRSGNLSLRWGEGMLVTPAALPYARLTFEEIIAVADGAPRDTAARHRPSSEWRLHAAVVPEEFIRRYGGVVGENHVIFIVPTRSDAVPAADIAALLSSKAASVAYNRVGGSASISSKVLATLPLPSICPDS